MVRRPILDDNDKQDILERTKELAPQYVEEWDTESDDAGTALLTLFGELGEDITERLNQMPVKHRTTFLDMLDFTPNPPQPAMLPLTFEVRSSAPENVVIPEGTTVQAVETDERPAQEFETVSPREFEATPADIEDIYSVDAGIDQIVDHSDGILEDGEETLFTGENQQRHALYMGHDRALVERDESFEVIVTTTAPPDVLREFLQWEFYGENPDGEEGWHEVTVHDRNPDVELSVSELTRVERSLEKLGLLFPHEGVADRTDAATPLTLKALADDIRTGRFAGPTADEPTAVPETLVDPDAVNQETLGTVMQELERLQQRLQRDAAGAAFEPEPTPVTLELAIDGETTGQEINGVETHWLRARVPDEELSHAIFNTLVESVEIMVPGEPEGEDETEDTGDGLGIEEKILEDLRAAHEQLPGSAGLPDPDEVDLEELDRQQRPDMEIDLGEKPEPDLDSVPENLGPSKVDEGLEDAPDDGGPVDPDMMFANNAQVNPAGGSRMMLFGELPMSGQTSEFACERAFSTPGTEVTMEFEHVTGRTEPPMDEPPTLVWEYSAGAGWKPLSVEDNTHGLQTSGTVRFEVPEDIVMDMYRGWKGHWIRVRLARGGYGEPRVEGLQDDNWQRVTDHIEYPEYVDVTITYDKPEPTEEEPEPTAEPEEKAEAEESVAAEETAPEPPEPEPERVAFSYLMTENNLSTQFISDETTLFSPFESAPGETQILYLGFNKRLEGGPVHLYFPIEETRYPGSFAPLIDVEYCVDPENDEWQRTGIEDGTEDLTERGILKISFPEPTESFELFGSANHWLRIKVTGDVFSRTAESLFVPREELEETVRVREVLSYQSLATRESQSYTQAPPRLDGLYPNTQWAKNIESIEDEPVGSSDGTSAQQFELPDSPALSVDVWVDELESLSDRMAQELIDDRSTTVDDVYDSEGHLVELWVKWTEVSDFIGSDSDAREYVLDETAGTITFGDGREGAIPPEGENNVRADYETGGGDEGNKQVGTIDTLMDPIQHVVDVTNHEPGKAGEPAEPLAEFVKRAPKNLRDRGKPVTRDGFVRITKSISREIESVRCIAGEDETDTPGKVILVIVPDVSERRPMPSEELINRVEAEMEERVPAAVVAGDRSNLTIRGPDYVGASVTATVTSAGTRSATTVTDRATTELTEFAHPLTGGPESSGWEIGTLPEPSVFAARLEKLDAVGHVKDLAVTYREGDRQLTVPLGEDPPQVSPDILVYSGRHTITVDVGGEQ